MQFHIISPIFVARQLVKHQVGLVWNEVSRRYVDDEPEFYTPKEWRLKSDDKKQGSSDETIEYNIEGTMQFMKQTYYNLLREQVAPEMNERMVLPQNLYTEWYWSGTINESFARVCNLRCAEDTQWETRQIANQIDEFVKISFHIHGKNYENDLTSKFISCINRTNIMNKVKYLNIPMVDRLT